MLNLQIHLLWASSQQHEGGMNLSQSCLWSHLDERLHLYLHLSACGGYIYIYIYTHTYTHTPGYACMSLWIKSVFPDTSGYMHVRVYEQKVVFQTYRFKAVTNWRYALTQSFVQLPKVGVHCWFCVCLYAASSFIWKYFSHISIKSTQSQYVHSFMTQAGYP